MLAIVPLKSPERAKSRLAGVLSAWQRRTLQRELALRTITALQVTPGIERVLVISASAELRTLAGMTGAETLAQAADTGTAAAFAEALAALPGEAARVLMIAGDLPLLDPGALQALTSPADASTVLMAADRRGVGTNALVCAPGALAPCFGEDSLRRHRAAARAAGLHVRQVAHPALSLDLDVPDDLETLRRLAPDDPLLALLQDTQTLRVDRVPLALAAS